MRVLVTRPEGTWPKLTARFAGIAVALQFSETTVQVDPIDPGPGDAAVSRLSEYEWLVVTSARGVSALKRKLAGSGALALPSELRVAAVGPATAAALVDIGSRADLVATDPNALGLVAGLVPRLAAGARVVVVQPEGTEGPLASALRAAGASVDEAPLYRTIASDAAPALAEAAIDGDFAAVVFTAPSSVSLWLDASGARRAALVAALTRVRRVAIGPTTAGRLSALALPAHATAETPTEPAIAGAIASVLGIDLLR